MNDIIPIINKFISLIEDEYKDIKIKYTYDPIEDMHWVYHNSKELEFESLDFQRFIGELVKSLIFQNNIFNFSFAYSYDYEQEVFESQVFCYNPLVPSNFNFDLTELILNSLPFDSINSGIVVETRKCKYSLINKSYSFNKSIGNEYTYQEAS